MSLQEFKRVNGISVLNFYKSNHSTRRVAAFGNNQLLITTEDFDRTKPAFVYPNPKDDSGYILSNKEQAAAEYTL